MLIIARTTGVRTVVMNGYSKQYRPEALYGVLLVLLWFAC